MLVQDETIQKDIASLWQSDPFGAGMPGNPKLGNPGLRSPLLGDPKDGVLCKSLCLRILIDALGEFSFRDWKVGSKGNSHISIQVYPLCVAFFFLLFSQGL
jgi:hypothetical protein